MDPPYDGRLPPFAPHSPVHTRTVPWAEPSSCDAQTSIGTVRSSETQDSIAPSVLALGLPQTTHRGLLVLQEELRAIPPWQRNPPAEVGALRRLLAGWGEGVESPPAELALIVIGVKARDVLARPLAKMVSSVIRAPGFYVSGGCTWGVIVLPETALYGGHQVAQRIQQTLPAAAGVRMALTASSSACCPPAQLLRMTETALDEALESDSQVVTPQYVTAGVSIFPGASTEASWLKPFPGLHLLMRQEPFRHAFRAFAQELKRFPWFKLHHSLQTAELASALASEAGLPAQLQNGVRLAGIFRDAGMLRIPEVLHSAPIPSSAYQALLHAHPLDSEKFLAPYGFSSSVLAAIRSHHERVDGTGYPLGLSGTQVPMEVQLLSIADWYFTAKGDLDVPAHGHSERALEVVRKAAGAVFSETLVEPLERLLVKQLGSGLGRKEH